jgi:cellulose synthase/poly-beta-1,6-N-acetylglucosamine synthase-like glycosyltransferase
MSLRSLPSPAVAHPTPVRGRHRLARERVQHGGYLILAMLGAFLLTKIIFRLPDSNAALYVYGVAVTAVVFLQMCVSFLRYEDPALTRVAPRRAVAPEPAIGPTDAHAAGPAPVLVSCLVAVHNDELVIEQCVRSLVGQTYPHLEVVVVDDASTDDTAGRLASLADECGIRVITLEENVGKKKALAVALLETSGEVFAFSDSDSVWAPDAVERAVGILERHPEVGAISGHCRALNAEHSLLTKVQDTWYEGQFSVRKAFESAFGAVTCVSGPLAVFRRETIYNYIPAWTSDRFLGEEFRFATDRSLTAYALMGPSRARLLQERHRGSPFLATVYPWQRWTSVYSKSMRAWTVVPHSFTGLLHQQVRWKKSFVRNLFFTGGFYWRRPALAVVAYYLHALFVFAGPIVAFRHVVYLPLHGNIESGVSYLLGILLIGTMFGLAFRREETVNRAWWVFRPLMSFLSTLVLSWLILYSIVTVKRMTWVRG